MPEGTIAGNRPTALPAPMSELDTPLRAGMGPSGSGDWGDALAVGLALTVTAAAVTATVSSAAGGVHVAEVTMLAAAVSVTELTELAPDATGIWASRLTVCLSDTELTGQLAVLSPLAQPLVNAGFWLVGLAESVTNTSETGPFSVETCTTNAASCPRLMLDCPRWTLTHSSGADAAALALGLELALGPVLASVPAPALVLAFASGLVARLASRDALAVPVADDEVADDDGAADDAVADPDGEGDPETEDDPDDDPDGDGSAVAVALGSEEELGSSLGSTADADADGEGDGEGEGEGEGDGEGEGVGEGEGDGVLDDGRS